MMFKGTQTIGTRNIEEDLKLRYHFGGQDVAYLPSDQGRMLIAAGQIDSQAFREALEELKPGKSHRAKAVLLSLSDPTTQPIAAATTKAASGAWPGKS